MKKQRGVSLGGLIVILFLVIMGALLAFKLIPPYMEYFTIQKTFKALAADPELKGANRSAIMVAWSRYATIDNITLDGDDIAIEKDGNDLVFSASYSVKVPLVKNISMLIDFKPTSR